MRAWAAAALLFSVLGAAGCGEREAHPYPEEARADFHAQCPADDAVCACTWDELTRSLTYEEYEAALSEFRENGRMDPRVTRARTECLDLADDS